MNLIEQVLDLDANAKKGPWDYRKDHTGDCDVNMFSANDDLVARMFFGAKGFEEAELVKVYRTAAPKLARAVDKAKKKLAVLERMSLGATGDLVREIIAGIDIINDDAPAKATP